MRFDGFQWDSGNWPKCGSHGVSQFEIEAVLRDAPRVAPVLGRSEDRYVATGRNAAGRPMFVAFTVRITDAGVLIRPVSARYMHEKEAKRYAAQSPQNDH